MSFQEIYPGEVSFVGFSNYNELVTERFYTALSNSFWYTFWTIAILVPLPIILAVALHKATVGNTVYRALLFVPSLVSVVVAGTLIRLLFASNDQALVNSLFRLLGGESKNWLLAGQPYAMILLVVLATWKWTGVNIVYFLAGINSIPHELYEAATIDGADWNTQFWKITLPLIKPTIIFVITISIFGGFSMFEESYILWAGNESPNNVGLTMVGYLYQRGFQQANLGVGSAIGVVLITIVFIISIVQLNLFGFFKEEQ
ncbi:carbohydrate ABC transporter permease [Spirochaeta cellobiosiphila]|uniref:carbohydrate ABC transporter permease n=1 Tax=Spirochaeta cellobiosiphila TaxID=504483 RepID=UPI001FE117FB|nr:sugar ABC transporter permease [Spirochaeta cellobiosiphila]